MEGDTQNHFGFVCLIAGLNRRPSSQKVLEAKQGVTPDGSDACPLEILHKCLSKAGWSLNPVQFSLVVCL